MVAADALQQSLQHGRSGKEVEDCRRRGCHAAAERCDQPVRQQLSGRGRRSAGTGAHAPASHPEFASTVCPSRVDAQAAGCPADVDAAALRTLSSCRPAPHPGSCGQGRPCSSEVFLSILPEDRSRLRTPDSRGEPSSAASVGTDSPADRLPGDEGHAMVPLPPLVFTASP